MTKVFVDGSAGTTGLRILDRLAGRSDLQLLRLPEELRKDPAARADRLNEADIVFLCLPDAAAREAVQLIENENTRVIDTSTAHRTSPDWVYGFAELKGRRERIQAARRVANPGCHASGVIALAAPLREAGLLPAEARLKCFSLTGYSGGGKKMIQEYEEEPDPLLSGPRQYGLGQEHKHLPEMQKECGLEHAPIFCPIVAPYYAGMEVTIPLFREEVGAGPEEIREVYRSCYREGLIRYAAEDTEGGFLSAAALEGRDDMEITVRGNEERILLIARFDNLGKGASGAAIQNMNLMIGAKETLGLELK